MSRTKNGKDSICVVVDKFSKMEHFIQYEKVDDACLVVNLFFKEVVHFRSLPKSIVSYCDTKFLNHFRRALWGKVGTKLLFFTTCHPQTDGQNEVVNITFSTILRVTLKKNLKMWKEWLSHEEFAYKRFIHRTTQHLPFEICMVLII